MHNNCTGRLPPSLVPRPPGWSGNEASYRRGTIGQGAHARQFFLVAQLIVSHHKLSSVAEDGEFTFIQLSQLTRKEKKNEIVHFVPLPMLRSCGR